MKGAWKGFFATLGSEILIAAVIAAGQKLAEALVTNASAIPDKPKHHAKKQRNTKKNKKIQLEIPDSTSVLTGTKNPQE